MNLVPYRHFDLFRDFDDSFERLLGKCSTNNSCFDKVNWTPRVDIREEENRLVVAADIPGVDPKDVEVTYEDGVLNVSGERSSGSESKGDGYYRVERHFGKFSRSFKLPSTVDAENISASGKNGVLEISIPKTEKAKPRRIEIQ